MISIEKQFTVILTEKEVDYLTTALHGEYKCVADRIKKNQSDATALVRDSDRMQVVRHLRDDFGNLIGRRYMGEDA